MKFTVLLPVRDEADIVDQCLRALLSWADEIYIFDTGSVDDTWDIVLEAARIEKRLIPLRREPVFFSETRLRAYMFDVARSKMRNGDWFVRADADEFHHVLPPAFVSSSLVKAEGVVYHQYYDFRLIQSEVDQWERGEESIADRQRSVEERRRHYTVSSYAEPRLCRYRETMKWPANCSFPINAGLVARERIPIRHYPHRDPVQMARRSRLRHFMMHDQENRKHWSQPELHHWCEDDWRAFIVADDTPDLRLWRPGEVLPPVREYNHLKPSYIRSLQRILHSLPLRYADCWRPSFPGDNCLQRISPELQNQIEKELLRSG